MKKFLENKTVAYYLAIVDAFLALVFGIVYMATYSVAIGNNAAGMVPESVGIFMLAGALVQIVLCVLPQYKFIGLVAVVLFGLSLYKEIYLIPDFLAGLANGIEYNGGNAALNIFYLVSQLIIMIVAVVITFMKFFKEDAVAESEFRNVKGTVNLAKIGGGSALVLVAVLASTLTVGAMKKSATTGPVNNNSSNSGATKKEKFNPLTDEVKELCKSAMPDAANDPANIIIAKEAEYDFSSSATEFTSLSASSGKTRADHYLVYLFEGAYSEGYQGKYNEYYTNLYLWDDGLFTGKSNSQTFKGYWYNDADGDGTVDCLNMVSDSAKYASLVTSKATGFYSAQAYVYMHPGWGDGRSIIVSGYMYYDLVALAIDATQTGTKFKVGDMFSVSDWTLNRILANQNYSAVFNTPDGDSSTKTTWDIPSGLIVDGKFAQAGTFTISASWSGKTASIDIVVEAAAE